MKFFSINKDAMRDLTSSDNFHAMGLIIPKIQNIISTSLIQIARLKGNYSIEKIEHILRKYLKRFPDFLRLQTINYFAPLILHDLNKIGIIPDAEVQKEEKKYMMYSHEFKKGKQISESEYLALIEIDNNDYLIWLDMVNDEFFIKGEEQDEVDPIQKKAISLLIKHVWAVVEYRDLFESLSRVAESNEYYGWDEEHMEEYINRVHRWFSDLHKNTKPKGILKDKYVKNVENKGYKFKIKKETKYCLIESLI